MRLTLCEAPTHETRPVCGFFNVSTDHIALKMQELGPMVYLFILLILFHFIATHKK